MYPFRIKYTDNVTIVIIGHNNNGDNDKSDKNNNLELLETERSPPWVLWTGVEPGPLLPVSGRNLLLRKREVLRHTRFHTL